MKTEIVNPNAEPAPSNPSPAANGQPGPEPAPGAEIVSAEAEPSTLNHPSSVVPLTNEDQPLAAPEPGEGGSTAQKHRHRNGHVARLPKEIRQRINEMLDDGFAYKQIIENLGEHGAELNEDIIYRWKTGGYQDYLREQRLLDQCRLRRERAFDLLAGASHINGFQATQQLAAAQICETVADLGADTLREQILDFAIWLSAIGYRLFLQCHRPQPPRAHPRSSAVIRAYPRLSTPKLTSKI